MSTVIKDLGAVSAYAYAVEKGYTGTEAEFAELMADYAAVGQRAEDAAESALNSKTAAQTAATTATNKASEATTAATTATTKAGEASTSASTATSAKDTAVSASQTATTKAGEATTAAATATSAKTDAVAANTAAQSAKTAAQTAQTGAETAAASVEASAEQIATNAEDISQLKSELTSLDEAIKTINVLPAVQNQNGKYCTISGGNRKISSIANNNVMSFDISNYAGQNIIISSKLLSTTYNMLYVVYDSSNVALDYHSETNVTSYTDYVITVPSNAYRIDVNYDASESCEVKLYEYNKKIDISRFNSIIPNEKYNNTFTNTTVNTTGVISASTTSLTCGMISIPKNSLFSISISGDYHVRILEWETVGETYTGDSSTLYSDFEYVAQYGHQCIIIARNDGGTISTSEAENIEIKIQSVSKMIADSAATVIGSVPYLSASGDTSDRSADITNYLVANGFVMLGKGNFYINSTITMPEHSKIIGSGRDTILIVNASLNTAIILSGDNEVASLTMEGQSNSKPSSVGGRHALSLTAQDKSNNIHDCVIKGFQGCAIYVYNTYSATLIGVTISNCLFYYDGCGVYLGQRSEWNGVANCNFNDCNTGIFCIGGNNRITGCAITRCTNAVDMRSSSTTNNNGHSSFSNLNICHNSHAIRAQNIVNGSVFQGCQIFFGDVSLTDCVAIMIIGSELGTDASVSASGGSGNRLSNCIFMIASPTVSGVSVNDCTLYDGTDFVLP